jgi:CBS domain containing-hemolysin-like protein
VDSARQSWTPKGFQVLLLFITAALVVSVSAFCSLCEAVLYALPASHVADLAEQGNSSAETLDRLRQEIDRPITAILTVNTIANTTGAAIAGSLAASALSDGSVVVFSIALTVAILLFSEIIPKTIGVVHTKVLAPWLARPLALMVFVLTPVIAIISGLTRTLAGANRPGVSLEEIASLARLGSTSGVIDAGEAAVIQNILTLPKRRAKDIMTPRMVTFSMPVATTVAEAVAMKPLMVHSRIPVYGANPDEILGLVFRRDVLAHSNRADTLETLVRPVEFVVEKEPADSVLDLMLAKKTHILIVLGEFGGFAGVVSLEDVLEEILGEEIVDEFDHVADLRQLAHDRREEALARTKA